jgi:peptidoglycan-associated lipoprotein
MKKLLSALIVMLAVSGCSLINPNCGVNATPSDTVYFDYDSSILKHDAQVTLSQQLESLTEDDSPIVIEGHADERGTREYNIGLGARRANEVRNYLLSKGIESGRMTTISYGKDKPAVEGHDESAWSKNRRAVVIVEDVE